MLLKIIISFFILFYITILQAENANFGNLPDFEFTDSFQKKISSEDLKNNYWILNFFFTSCPKICPIVNGKIATLANKYKDQKNLKFISISVDPARDTIEVLQEYSKKFNANKQQWHLINLEKETLDNFLNQLMLATTANVDNHSTRIFLIKPNNKIHSMYQGLDTEDFNRLNNTLIDIFK